MHYSDVASYGIMTSILGFFNNGHSKKEVYRQVLTEVTPIDLYVVWS
jgi:hypothetical protein